MSKKRPYRTHHQREIMGIILAAAGQGKLLTSTELHGLVSYEASYGAIRKTITTLVEGGMIVRRREGNKKILHPTERGQDWFRPVVV